MTADAAEVDRLPTPPRNLPAPGLELDIVESLVVFRLHGRRTRSGPGATRAAGTASMPPENGAEYPVTYANRAIHGALAEVYGDTQLISARERNRRLSTITATRPIALIALDDPTVQKTLGLDGRIAMSKQYFTTTMWSRALHRWFPAADGICYASRHAGAAFPNLCLFLDRSRTTLMIEPQGTLADARLRASLQDQPPPDRINIIERAYRAPAAGCSRVASPRV